MGFVAATDAEYGQTAALLLAMNAEAGFHVREVRTANGGFFVPDAVSDQLRAGVPPVPAVEAPAEPKTPPPGWDDPLPEPVVEQAEDGNFYVEAANLAAEVGVTVHEESDEPEADRETIRAWAKANGHDVADVGRLKTSVIEAYKSVQQVE